MLKNNHEKRETTETAIKLINHYADSYHLLENKLKILKQENDDLKYNLQVNKDIIQGFFKISTFDKKIEIFINKIKEENKLLYKQIQNLKKENNQLNSLLNEMNNLKSENEIYKKKIFILKNLVTEKENIIEILSKKNSHFKENSNVIFITSPSKILNKINSNLLTYKEMNEKLLKQIKTLKLVYSKKEKDLNHLESELIKYRKENSKLKQQKNNFEILSQLNQYHQMNSSFGKNTLSKTQVIQHSQQTNDFISTLNSTKSLNKNKKNLYNEIERLENVNKNTKNMNENQFDLTSEWYETLKHCNMTQDEYVKYCNSKITCKLTDVIEYLYKLLLDKNIQIKLLMEENEELTTENLKLNKINLHLGDEMDKIQKSNINNNDDGSTFVNTGYLSLLNANNNVFNDNDFRDFKLSKQSLTSSEFREGMIMDQFELNSEVLTNANVSLKNSEKDLNNININKEFNKNKIKKINNNQENRFSNHNIINNNNIIINNNNNFNNNKNNYNNNYYNNNNNKNYKK